MNERMIAMKNNKYQIKDSCFGKEGYTRTGTWYSVLKTINTPNAKL